MGNVGVNVLHHGTALRAEALPPIERLSAAEPTVRPTIWGIVGVVVDVIASRAHRAVMVGLSFFFWFGGAELGHGDLDEDDEEAEGVADDQWYVVGHDAVDHPEEVADADEVFHCVGSFAQHACAAEDGGYPADNLNNHVRGWGGGG